MYNIIEDSAKLLTVDKKVLDKVSNLMMLSISEAVKEDKMQDNTITECDVGIGTLIISHEFNELKFKFIPNDTLVTYLLKTNKSKKSVLEDIVTKSLVNKLVNTYKDLLQ